MATRNDVVSLVRQTLEHPFECIKAISKYVVENYTTDVPYSHIWTSYIANEVGLVYTQAPLTASCDKGANWFRKRKRYKLGQAYGGDYNPQLGDYIYLSSTYEQADATNVGIVLSNDGTLVTLVHWCHDNGCPKEQICYLHDPIIIGYGIPEYEDVSRIEMPELATKGNGVAIVGEECCVHIGPDSEAGTTGVLKKGYAVEVLAMQPNGWMKVVWGLTPTGYAFVDNTKFLHKIIQDEECPYCGQSKTSRKKKAVDFITKRGYNQRKGEVIEDKACLRIGPGKEFTKVQKWPQMAKGNVVDIIGQDTDNDNNGWYLVTICGVKGYVEQCCVKISSKHRR